MSRISQAAKIEADRKPGRKPATKAAQTAVSQKKTQDAAETPATKFPNDLGRIPDDFGRFLPVRAVGESERLPTIDPKAVAEIERSKGSSLADFSGDDNVTVQVTTYQLPCLNRAEFQKLNANLFSGLKTFFTQDLENQPHHPSYKGLSDLLTNLHQLAYNEIGQTLKHYTNWDGVGNIFSRSATSILTKSLIVSHFMNWANDQDVLRRHQLVNFESLRISGVTLRNIYADIWMLEVGFFETNQTANETQELLRRAQGQNTYSFSNGIAQRRVFLVSQPINLAV